MPVYGYRCSRGHMFEVQQRITDAPLDRCPECGAPVTRVFYPVGIIFKGQGFYKTDSRGATTEAASGKEVGKADAKPDKGKPAETKTASAASTDKSAPSSSDAGPAKSESKPEGKSA
jgi:putative FmdB family regulatory protein